MTTAEDYEELSRQVYLVDPLKKEPPLGENARIGIPGDGQMFQVIKVATNPVTGFQAMAVVPVVNKVPDYSHVTVAFAGTNPDHRADMLADVESVVGGASGVGTQVDEAFAFARDAQEFAAKKNGGAAPSMSTTGHSLGGYLGLLVGGEFGWSSTTFNAPDPYDRLSPEVQKRLRAQGAAGKNPLTNYVDEWDMVGNFFHNGTGAAVYVKDKPGRDPLNYHNLDDAFRFDPTTGAVVGAGARGHSDLEILDNIATKLPGGSALTPMLGGVLTVMRDPGSARTIVKNIAGLAVAVDTVAAVGLAASIAGTAESLRAIRAVNGGLVDQMQNGLNAAMSAVYVPPFISERDIMNCVHEHGLLVSQNIDEDAVAGVQRLVEDQIGMVEKVSAGIEQTVVHAVEQDAQWALLFGGR